MGFHRTPLERPREQKRFLTVREVEDMAKANIGQIVQAPDLVITDAAREAAIDLGIQILAESTPPERERAEASRSAAGGSALRSRPAPAVALPRIQSGEWRGEDPLVRALVDAIAARWRSARRQSRQLAGPGPD